MRRYGCGLLLACAVHLLPVGAFAQEEQSDLAPALRRGEERRARWQQHIKDESRRRERAVLMEQQTLKRQAEELQRLSTVPAISNDVRETAHEPASADDVVDKGPVTDIFDISDRDFNFVDHVIWSLNPQDFRFWQPVRAVIKRPAGSSGTFTETDLIAGTERVIPRDVFFAIPFALTNSTSQSLSISPRLWLVSQNMRFTPEISGVIVRDQVEKSMARSILSTGDFIGYVKDLPDGSTESVGSFEAGETRHGVGVFHMPDPEFNKLTLVVEGLNNTYRFGRKQKRVLTVNFSQLGDEFHANRRPIEFVGKEWAWMWMWDQEIGVSPIESHAFETQTGRQKQLWSYQVTIGNSTEEDRNIRFRKFNTTLEMKVMDVDVEVEFVDDGRSTVHKVKVMEDLAYPFTGDRFAIETLSPQQVRVFPVIFDADDINWEGIYEQVQRGRSGSIAIGYGEAPLKPGLESFVIDPARLAKTRLFQLSDEQKDAIRREVSGSVASAMESANNRGIIMANVTAEAGIASGEYRILRSHFRKGVIESDWIHKWLD